MPVKIGDQFERYRIEARLERGGLHNRYRARHEYLGTLFSLVEIAFHKGTATSSGQPSNEASFELMRVKAREAARLQARVRHPNVLRLIDRFEHAGTPWLVEEYTFGVVLRDMLDQRRPLPVPAVDTVAAGLFAGVAALHARGIVHRDLQPRNVWVATETGSLCPQVTGFALACGTDVPSGFPPGSLAGTPAYMSPEHTRGIDSCDAVSDVWSLAVMLYKMATGKVPFDQTSQALYRQIRAGTYADPRCHRDDVPDRWRNAIAAALVTNPADRVQRVDVLSRLWFAGEPPVEDGPSLTAPTGDVTLLFCDVEGSTSLWEHDPALTRECLLAYDAVVREALLRSGGYEVKTEGDSFMIAFSSPELAVRCAVDVQTDLARQPWPDRLLAQPEACEERGLRGLRVRMGVHRCAPEPRPDAAGRMDYFGLGVNRAARVMAAAHGGQVLVDGATLAACGAAPGWRVRSLGSHRLKGISTEIELLDVSSPDLPVRAFDMPRV